MDTHDLSREELEEFRRAFDILDRDKEGYFTARNLTAFSRTLGKEVSETQMQDMVNEVDADGTGVVTFDEFLEAMVKRMTRNPDDEDLRGAFCIFDKERTGYIGVDQIRKVLVDLHEQIYDDEIEEIIRGADADGDGQLSYEEFVSMMTQNQTDA